MLRSRLLRGSHDGRFRRAFSLIELLVVIRIVLLMIALLLSVIRQARAATSALATAAPTC